MPVTRPGPCPPSTDSVAMHRSRIKSRQSKRTTREVSPADHNSFSVKLQNLKFCCGVIMAIRFPFGSVEYPDTSALMSRDALVRLALCQGFRHLQGRQGTCRALHRSRPCATRVRIIPMAAPRPYNRTLHSVAMDFSFIDCRHPERCATWLVNATNKNSILVEPFNDKFRYGAICPVRIS